MIELLAKIGIAPDWSVTMPADPNVCQECGNTGWVYPSDDAKAVVRCPLCLSRSQGKAPGIPETEHGSILENFIETSGTKRALDEAKLFLSGLHPNLYLWGGVGCGKTRLACSLLNELHAKRVRVEFFRVSRLLGTMMPGSEQLDAMVERIASIPVVCLDDVGANQASDFARRMLLVLYESRTDRLHRTIWTSNMDLGELAAFTGDDRLSSRIAGSAKTVELSGPDWRLRRR